ncbi:MAG TPA: phosphomannomutase/phosphoglucomutase [Syntrophorhabdaceae bacterium]|nr:phosphomannomutase/phosphoglucomutase [Syntrophorhabdaceae bacterium]
MNNAIFREYDIRGDVEKDLTDDVVRSIGRAFAAYVIDRGKRTVSIARDCRLSSEHYRDLVVQTLVESGLDVIDIGLVPTGLFYYSLFNLEVEGGIMITGSHNPPTMNGFKIASGKSTLYGDQIQDIRRIIEKGEFKYGEGSCTEYENIVADYYAFLRTNIHVSKQFKVVVDAGNGTGGVVGVPIMKEMGQNVTDLFCDMDGRFPNHFPDPTVEKNIEVLRRTVLEQKADVGIGYDGDADRIGIIDEKGNIIWGDYLMIIFARDILKTNKGATFVSEVKCSRNLYEDIERNGGKAIMWKAGHSLIKQKMKETNALMGGEMSGHIFFADKFFGYDDAIYASLRFLEIMEKDGRPVSQFLADLPMMYSTPEIRLECPDSVKFDVVRKLTEEYKRKYNVIDTDGVRVTFDDGWGLVRSSNTQPILVLRFEAVGEESLNRIQDMVMTDLRGVMNQLGVTC